MICEACGTNHDGSYGSGRFCSNRCSRSFSTRGKRDEINKAVSSKLKGKRVGGSGKKQSPEHVAKRLESLKTKRDLIKAKQVAAAKDKYVSKLFDELSAGHKRRRVFEEQNFKCVSCGLDEWLGKPITLEIEHRDGNTSNNARDNLIALCPNCHSYTPTWRRRKTALVVQRQETAGLEPEQCEFESHSAHQ